jgi:hypothetical protein
VGLGVPRLREMKGKEEESWADREMGMGGKWMRQMDVIELKRKPSPENGDYKEEAVH